LETSNRALRGGTSLPLIERDWH